jgi:NhaA family Na+:H+ antiporter
MAIPALIYFFFTVGDGTSVGFGIPMATDIAFALGILSLAGKRVPLSLKIFLTALAIIDDLGAITVIALFYSKGVSIIYLLASIGMFIILFIAGKKNVRHLSFYILGGVIMWYLMLKSGIHPSISGVLLAFAIPFHRVDSLNPSYRLQHMLHYPVALVILPVFALANTAIPFPSGIWTNLTLDYSLGIIIGLVVGKFVGIFVVSYLAVRFKIGSLPEDVKLRHLAGIGLLGGIGFTMSIFIANLAFDDPVVISSAKISVLFASAVAAIGGLGILMSVRRR